MPYRLGRLLQNLRQDEGFREFQNGFAEDLYTSLSEGQVNGEDELGLVNRMLAVCDGKSHSGVRIVAPPRIHGGRSMVRFQHPYGDGDKELADAAIIFVLTEGNVPRLIRISFVQNKKAAPDGRLAVDEGQLFLLKNFPTFSGVSGLFDGRGPVILTNHSHCLGAYSFFVDKGEMMFVTAARLRELLRSRGSINYKNIGFPGSSHADHWDGRRYEEALWWDDLSHIVGYGPEFSWSIYRAASFCRDNYDWVRCLTTGMFGEPCFARGHPLSPSLYRCAGGLLREAGVDNLDLPGDGGGQSGVAIVAVVAEVKDR